MLTAICNYDGRQLYDVSEQTSEDIAEVVSEYVQFSHYQYWTNKSHNISLLKDAGLWKQEVGYAYAAVDAYGECYIIIKIGPSPDDTKETMAIKYDWKS